MTREIQFNWNEKSQTHDRSNIWSGNQSKSPKPMSSSDSDSSFLASSFLASAAAAGAASEDPLWATAAPPPPAPPIPELTDVIRPWNLSLLEEGYSQLVLYRTRFIPEFAYTGPRIPVPLQQLTVCFLQSGIRIYRTLNLSPNQSGMKAIHCIRICSHTYCILLQSSPPTVAPFL